MTCKIHNDCIGKIIAVKTPKSPIKSYFSDKLWRRMWDLNNKVADLVSINVCYLVHKVSIFNAFLNVYDDAC